jgi:uncharacterized protein
MIFSILPKEEAFFELFKKAAHNVIEGSQLLKDLMEDYTNIQEKIVRIKEVEHIGDGITHDIAMRLNQTFITPIDREDIHDLASALDDILDAIEAVADRFAIYKIEQPTPCAIRLADILYQASVAVGRGVDRISMSHEEVKEYSVAVNSLEMKPIGCHAMRFPGSLKMKQTRLPSSSGKRSTRRLKREPIAVRMSPT